MEREVEVGRIELSTGIGLPYRAAGPREAAPRTAAPCVGGVAPGLRSTRHGAAERRCASSPSTNAGTAVPTSQTGYSLVDFADDVVASWRRAGLPPTVLLGASSGGYVAQQVALTHPSGWPDSFSSAHPRTLQRTAALRRGDRSSCETRSPSFVGPGLAHLVSPLPRTSRGPTSRTGWLTALRTPARVWRETFEGLCAAVPPTDAGTITCPTLIVWGDRDQLL